MLNGAAFTINGGSIDNVTGGSLTTDNYPITWNGGFTFVGSNPLNLGTGGVTLGSSAATVKVSGSTLEIDGAIGDSGQGYGFTQSGAGVLLLTASNTYFGPDRGQRRNAPGRQRRSGAFIDNTSAISLGANAVLFFNDADTVNMPMSISGSGSLVQSLGLIEPDRHQRLHGRHDGQRRHAGT